MPESHCPLFSIITITYNAEKVLERTIQSVVAQKRQLPSIEYIIVDGASKDHTMHIVEDYKEYIDKVTSEPDKGLYDAMNKGIAQATGQYLCFLNAGDKFHEADSLSQIAKKIEGLELPDILYGQTDIVNLAGGFLHKRRLQAPEKLNWKSFKKGMLVCHQAFFARRDIAENYNLHYRYSADFDWCIRLMKKSKILFNTKQTLIDYLDEGLTTNNRYDSLWERFHIMAHHYGIVSTVMHHILFVFRLLFVRSK